MPIFEPTSDFRPIKLPTTNRAVTRYKTRKVEGVFSETPKRLLKSVRPLVPPRFISFRLHLSQVANAIAWVRMAKYVPLTRRRNVKTPKIHAATAGITRARSTARGKYWKGFQNTGRVVTRFHTM